MANNKTQDKYHIPFMIEKFKEYVNKKHSKYPTFEQLYFENNWVRQNVHKILKSEAGKEITEETLTFWYSKLKEKQRKMLLEKIYINKSVQGLIFLAKYCHGIGLEKDNEESSGSTELDYKLEILRHDIELFFQLARKENIDPAKKFVHLEGGRAGGKSEQAARYVILKALERKTNGSLLCGREVQKSIETSVKPLLERIIKLYHLENYFNITKQEILSKHNNVRIIFMGLKEASSDASDTLKSTDLLFLAWIEEAQSISELSLEKLIPTAARVEDYQIIFTYNRHRQNTIIYDYFFYVYLTRERQLMTQHININYYDNKFNSPELISLAELDKAANLKKWKYIWNGEPQTEFDGALWTYEEIKDLNLNLSYDKDNYVRRIVATDPAASSKDFNNEYGITVLGITHEGYVHLIADVSGHYTASEYAKVLVKTYFNYECEAVVYEENQGGDHVANTILSESKSVRLIPVRATQSKYLRALPVANLCSQGKVYFLKSFPKLENQMLLLTIQGYQGEQGESPDRLDSFVWGVYELLGLKDVNSIDVYFKRAWFKCIDDIAADYNITNKIAYYSFKGSKSVFILFDYFYTRDGLKQFQHFLIKEIKSADTNEIAEKTKDYLNDVNSIIAFDNENIDFSCLNTKNIERIEIEKLKLIDYAAYSMPYIQNKLIYLEKNQELERTIIDNVCQYIPEEVKENIILETLLELIYYEFEGEVLKN